jgi:hypothetical protein
VNFQTILTLSFVNFEDSPREMTIFVHGDANMQSKKIWPLEKNGTVLIHLEKGGDYLRKESI